MIAFHPLEPDGLWCEELCPRPERLAGRPALILDRDGVLVEEVGYLHRPVDLRLIAGAAELIAAAARAEVAVVVCTNQSGIGRGLYGWDAFAATQAELLARLAELGARPDMVLACPFHPVGRPPYRHPDHPDRKPRPGMILRAAERLGLDLSRSWIVGDRAIDLEAGRAAALAGGLLILTGQGREELAAARLLADPAFAVRCATSLAAALELPPLASDERSTRPVPR